MNPVTVTTGDSPIVLAMPHTGSYLPSEVLRALNDTGKELSDTDWQIDTLYADLLPNATVVKANFHRYVIDANRDPSGESLYPGQNTTGLCPLTDFDGKAIYQLNAEPSTDEIEQRRQQFHSPYHQALAEQLAAAKTRHGIAVLYDCHSIRSQIPFLFDGQLPDFNVGTFEGASCDARLSESVVASCQTPDYSQVLNGRFKGGWTTRHYGQPDTGIHAVQMELSQRNYMQESAPWDYLPERAEKLRLVLGPLLRNLEKTALSLI